VQLISLGFQTDMLSLVERHPRLLRGVVWKNEDYPSHALTVMTKMLDSDLANLGVMLQNPKIIAWLRENEPELYVEFFDDGAPIDAIPRIDQSKAIHDFLCRPAAAIARTKGFEKHRHDPMLVRLRHMADEQLPGRPTVVITQSLQDSGCDLTIYWGGGAKYGVQLKSHSDISKPDFAGKTVGQIQYSKQHGLKRLYVLLAGDMTDQSHVQKVRGFTSSVSKMNDKYVHIVPPERLWTLLFAEEGDK